jgi:hypothetical protein
MAPPIMGMAYLVMKAERAKLHLGELNRELDAFAKEPFTVITKEDTENSRYIRRTQFKAMDPIIGMLLGEFLYNLRSGLDQLAWQIATPGARKDFPTVLSFPIFEKASNSEERRNYKKALNWFPADAQVEIDAVQPYKQPDAVKDHPLWLLNKLCNIDKHSVIPINSRSVNVFVPHNPAVKVDHFDYQDAIEVSVPLADKAQLDFEPDHAFPIEFGEWDSDLIVPRHKLADILGFIECTIIPTFRKFASDRAVATPPMRVGVVKTVYK